MGHPAIVTVSNEMRGLGEGLHPTLRKGAKDGAPGLGGWREESEGKCGGLSTARRTVRPSVASVVMTRFLGRRDYA